MFLIFTSKTRKGISTRTTLRVPDGSRWVRRSVALCWCAITTTIRLGGRGLRPLGPKSVEHGSTSTNFLLSSLKKCISHCNQKARKRRLNQRVQKINPEIPSGKVAKNLSQSSLPPRRCHFISNHLGRHHPIRWAAILHQLSPPLVLQFPIESIQLQL